MMPSALGLVCIIAFLKFRVPSSFGTSFKGVGELPLQITRRVKRGAAEK